MKPKECEQIRRRLAEHAVGALRGRARRRLEGHVEVCRACRRELRALERTGELLSAVGRQPAPGYAWDAIRRRIAAPRPAPARPQVRWRMAFAAAMLALAVVASFVLWPIGTSPPMEVELVAAVDADEQMQAAIEGHLSAVWAAPLSDQAALGLLLAGSENGG